MTELVFVDGAITSDVMVKELNILGQDIHIGAHSIFIGQVRNDQINDKHVKAIEYTSYQEMAQKVFSKLSERLQNKFGIKYFKVYHSIGVVESGSICLFVITAGKHRRGVLDATDDAVEDIKKNLPVWGKEIFEDEGHQWKVNK
jgi:molybdopterin synthase catalytic subunit